MLFSININDWIGLWLIEKEHRHSTLRIFRSWNGKYVMRYSKPYRYDLHVGLILSVERQFSFSISYKPSIVFVCQSNRLYYLRKARHPRREYGGLACSRQLFKQLFVKPYLKINVQHSIKSVGHLADMSNLISELCTLFTKGCSHSEVFHPPYSHNIHEGMPSFLY